MANQVIVTNTGNVQVALTPPPNVQVQISRAAIGTVSNVLSANFANYAGNVTVANQPNITSVGTLGNLNVSNTITTLNLSVTGNLSAGNLIANNANYANFANVANTANSVAVGNVSGIGNIAVINLDGSSSNVLFGNGVFAPESTSIANANYANFAGEAFSVSGSNVNGAVNLANFATTANAVAGANVSGEVANANYSSYANIAASANSVAVGNVVGIGNIATINLDGNAGNILYGNGAFAAVPNVANVANANYANFAGTAFSVSGSNVSGEVANANYASFANIASTANSVAGANVSGEVANANYSSYSNIASTANSVAVGNVSGIGNIATTNYDGNASNILYGNGGFFALPIISNVANANYANFAGEAFNVNASNITGTVANANYSAYAGEANTANLATFATTANAVAGANVSGEVANANYASFANVAASANSVAVGNVSGIGNIATINLDGSSSNVLFGNGVFAPESTSIANANYANFAGQVVDATQSNITSLGTLTGLSITGNANIDGVLTLSSTTTTTKIVGVTDSTNANARTLNINAGSVNSPNVGNGNTGGAMNFIAGSGSASTDPGSRFDGRGGSFQIAAGGGSTANGQAVGGAIAINAGNASSNLNTATGGAVTITSGRGTAANGSATSGTITIITRQANATTTGSATSGNINLLIGNANGVSANTIGSINIGSLAPNALVAFPLAINIGQTNSPTNIGGNANVSGNLSVTANANVTGNLNVTANANITGNLNVTGVITGNGSGITNISANYANFAGQVVDATQSNITTLGTLTNLSVAGNVDAQGAGLFNSPANNTDTLKLITNNKTNMNMIRMERYGDTANLGGIGAFNMYRAGGTQAAPTAVANNDVVYNLTTSVYGDSGNIFVDTGGFVVRVGTNYGNGTVTSIAEYNQGLGGPGQVTFNYDTINFNGASTFNGNANVTGNLTSGNANLGNLVVANFFSGDGSLLSNINGSNVSNVANANYANFAGTAYSVDGANVSGEVANANYASFANIASTANSVAGANVSGEVANANYASYAGNVTISTQSNITSLGNLINLNVANTVSNTRSPITQFSPVGITVGLTTNPLAGMLSTDYGSQASNAQPMNWNWVKARGNSTATTGAANNDNMMRLTSSVYNGNTYPRSVALTTAAPLAANSSYTGANVVWTPGSFSVTTGNPFGNVTSNTSNSPQNVLTFNQTGGLTITPGTNANGGFAGGITIVNFGSNSDGGGVNTGTITTVRYRGNRDSQAAVANNDNAGGYFFQAYNGTTLPTLGAFRMFVNTDYGAVSPGQPIGAQFQIQVNGNTGAYTTFYNGDGSVVFPSGGNAVVNVATLNVSANANITGNLNVTANANITGNLNVTGTISYNTRTFGSFTSNVTQTNSNVGNAVYMTLNNDEGSNGVSIVSSSQITVSRTGRYNIQFSAQMEKTDAGTDAVEIWLTKNGSPVANSATRLQIQGTNEKDVAAWNWVDNATTANTYYQIAWASTDANMQLVAIDSANTLSGVSVPSLIVTVVPVGA
jgi:hypothetical protein